MAGDDRPMDANGGRTPADESPERLLDEYRLHPAWDDSRRDEQFERLVAAFAAGPLREAARARLDDLRWADAEAVLRIVEAFGEEDDLRALAEALVRQPDLPPERAFEAFSLLEGSGLIEGSPALSERWEELSALFDGADVLGELARQLEEDPDGIWLALQGLEAVEPEVRAEIVEGLVAESSAGARPGRIPAAAHLRMTRPEARAPRRLEGLRSTRPSRAEGAWPSIAAGHPDPSLAAEGPRTGRGLRMRGPGLDRGRTGLEDGASSRLSTARGGGASP